MKKKSMFRSVFILALSLALILSLAASASATSITISGGTQAGMGGDGRFTAYQIFKGTTGTNPDELVGIEWGDGVESDNLVKALKESELSVIAGSESSTLGAKFSGAYEIWEATQKDTVGAAEFVAQFMAKYNNPACADEFARIIAANTKGIGSASKYESSEKAWKIDVSANGYYLVKDNYKTSSDSAKPDASVSSYILEVLGEETIAIKSSLPTVEKKVMDADGYLTATNRDVTFTLTGTVAENIGEYDTYSYKFTDTLSKGLAIDETLAGLEVKIVNGGDSKTIDKDSGSYTASVADGPADGEHVLTVTFADLKAAAASVDAALDKYSRIVVTYTAQLNNSAVVGNGGNENNVRLTYSNDPYSGGTGESVPDEVKTYTLGLNVRKKGEKGLPLSKVEFKLKNNAGKFAKLEEVKNSAEDKTEYYAITDWTDDDADGTVLVTDADGEFNIHGFDIGTYTLVETRAPEDYETMKDIVFDISCDGIDRSTGALQAVSWVLDEEDKVRTDAEFSDSDSDTGTAILTLINYKAPILPNTGGIGAKIVYVVSGLAVLIGVCIVAAALKKRKGDKA